MWTRATLHALLLVTSIRRWWAGEALLPLSHEFRGNSRQIRGGEFIKHT